MGGDTRVPLLSERVLQTALELRLAGVRMGQIFDQELRRFFVALLGNDYMCLTKVCSRLRCDTSNLLYQMRFRGRLARSLSPPSTLSRFSVQIETTADNSELTQPGKEVSTSRGASSSISRRLVSSNS